MKAIKCVNDDFISIRAYRKLRFTNILLCYTILLNKAENKEQSIQYLVLIPPENPSQINNEPGVTPLTHIQIINRGI